MSLVTRKTCVGIIFGGRSCEHDVSLISATHVMSHLDQDKYEVVPIGITRDGQWITGIQPHQLQFFAQHGLQEIVGRNTQVAASLHQLLFTPDDELGQCRPLDVIFPVIHGSPGEDGVLQGLLELAQIPYVGCGVLGSALGMNKEKMKLIVRAMGLPTVDFLAYSSREWKRSPAIIVEAIEQHIGYPCFVKPTSQGSSIGVNKVSDRSLLLHALDVAITYDDRFIVERALNCREFSCSVLGNEDPMVSGVGESLFEDDFFSYEAKYFNTSSRVVVHPDITAAASDEMRRMAVEAFRVLDLSGLARVDFFMDKETQQIYINEVNTLPSFTPQCMYPKLCEASGLSYKHLLDRLIELAFERQKQRSTHCLSAPAPLYV